MSIKIFLFGQIEQIQALKLMVSKSDEIEIVGSSDNENQVLDEIRRVNADMLLTYIDGSTAIYRVTQQIYMLCPQCINFALTPSDIYRDEGAQMFQNGIHYVYEDTLNDDELIVYIKNAYSIEKKRESILEEGKEDITSSKVLTFYSPKDGVGKSTFLLSYAAELAKRRQKVVILDFNLQFGDIHILSNIDTNETLAEMLQEHTNPTMDIIRQYIVYHKSGVNILCAPRNAEYADNIQGVQLEKIISTLRSYYDYILVDAASLFNDITYACCEQSIDIYVAVRPDIASLNHVKKVISMMESLNQREKLKLIFFDVIKGSEITPDVASKVLGIPVWHVVPYDLRSAIASINQGEPVVSLFPKSVLAKSCVKAVDKTIDKGNDKKKDKSLSRWRNKKK